MAQVTVSVASTPQNTSEAAPPKTKNDPTLKTASGEYQIEYFTDTKSLSEGVFEFLQEMNQPPTEEPPSLQNLVFTFFSPEKIDTDLAIFSFLELLAHVEVIADSSSPSATKEKIEKKAEQKEVRENSRKMEGETAKETPEIYSSLFSLARSFNHHLNRAKESSTQKQDNKTHTSSSFFKPQAAVSEKQSPFECLFNQSPKAKEREKEGKHDGSGQEENKKREQNEGKKQLKQAITKTQASKGVSASKQESSRTNVSSSNGVASAENIFVRFMALMAKILSQAEAEAHELYLRIKERTDNIDSLTLLLSKINSEKKDIDWSKNEEMKELIEKAKQLGVDIPDGKYKWTENEKKLLKENIQMRKDSMEKITQLERTDMQRYLQEASQCHQARSNVLKLLKEVMDTIIHNMRPS